MTVTVWYCKVCRLNCLDNLCLQDIKVKAGGIWKSRQKPCQVHIHMVRLTMDTWKSISPKSNFLRGLIQTIKTVLCLSRKSRKSQNTSQETKCNCQAAQRASSASMAKANLLALPKHQLHAISNHSAILNTPFWMKQTAAQRRTWHSN